MGTWSGRDGAARVDSNHLENLGQDRRACRDATSPTSFRFLKVERSRTARCGLPGKIRSRVNTAMRRPLNAVSRRPMKLTGPLLGALVLTLAVGWLGAALPALAPARGDDDPARPRNGYPVAYAIKDAKILTVSQGTIARGSILVENGKITAVGTGVKAKPGMAVIEAAGLVAMPGIIETHSHIAIQGGVNEFSLSIVPEVRVKDVVTGDDVSIYRALANGVLTAYVQPTGGLISGQGCVIDLRGWVPRELVVVDPAALDVTIPTFVARTPEGPRRRPGPGPAGAEGGPDPQARRQEQLEAIREHFRRALRYGEVVAQARSQGVAPPPFDPRLSALLQPTTSVLALFIDGKHLTPESRHTQLYARYLRRLEEVRAGSAPLGLDRPSTAPARIPNRAAASPAPASP